MSTAASSSRYAVGQLWQCKGRSDGERPTVLINRIDEHPMGGQIFHVTLDNLRIRNPHAPGGIQTKMAHAPITAPTLDYSEPTLIGEREIDPAYLEGYGQWKQAFEAGNAGAFGNTVAAITTIIEKQINGIPNIPPRH